MPGPDRFAHADGAGAIAHVSWNGATEVAAWQLLAGNAAGELTVRATGKKRSFETMLTAPTGARFAAVAALDRHGKVLATSKVVRV